MRDVCEMPPQLWNKSEKFCLPRTPNQQLSDVTDHQSDSIVNAQQKLECGIISAPVSMSSPLQKDVRFAYANEAALVEDLLGGLQDRSSPWGRLRTITEFDFRRGKTDVVALSTLIGVLAFEAKLTKWRYALQQAYRNRCFARRSFVVLPQPIAHNAAKFDEEFRRRGVGLCFVVNKNITILIDAADCDPWQQWLAAAAITHVCVKERGENERQK